MKTEGVIFFPYLPAAKQPILVHPAVDDIDMNAVRQSHKGQAAGGNRLRKDQLVIYHRHIQPLRQIIHQLFIIRIGVIKLKHRTGISSKVRKKQHLELPELGS
jgi:hypothetical protein